MSEALRDQVRQAADELAAGLEVPPVHLVHERLAGPASPAGRLLLPVWVAAAVAAVVLGAQVVTTWQGPASTATPDAPAPAASSPSPAAPDVEPELGTVVLDAETSRRLVDPQPGPRSTADGPGRVDVLARLELAPDLTMFTYGVVGDERDCVYEVTQDGSKGPGSLSTVTCRPGYGTGLEVGRAQSSDSDAPGSELLSGSAPAGTERLVLSSPGLADQEVPVTSGGSRWEDRGFFLAAWPGGVPTRVRALDAGGDLVAETDSTPPDPVTMDPDFLEAYVVCLEADGVEVTRTSQPGTGPAYSWNVSELAPDVRRRLEVRCDTAGRAAARG